MHSGAAPWDKAGLGFALIKVKHMITTAIIETEEFRPVKEFPNEYLVSNCGRVWSIRRNREIKGKLTNAGYLRVGLSVNGFRIDLAVHRLVAIAFIPNTENKPTVNHVNEIKTDNRADNLCWMTTAEQNAYGTRTQRARANTDYKARNSKMDFYAIAKKIDYDKVALVSKKPILQLDANGSVIARYDGVSDAAKAMGRGNSVISAVARGKGKSAYGYGWKYENVETP